MIFTNYALVKVRRDNDAVSPSVVDAVLADATGCDDANADASLCSLSIPLTSDLNVNWVTFDVRES